MVIPRDKPPLAEGRVELPPTPASAAAARRLVREVLAARAHEPLFDAAELAVSEAVTNAVLHAHTDLNLWLGLYDDQLCAEVRDFNPVLPVQRDYDVRSTTGRGMGLISTISAACGVHSLGDAGKVVWFCIAENRDELSADDVLAAWDIEDLEGLREAGSAATLRSMPMTLWLSAREHHDAIIRELVLYLAAHPDVSMDVASADAARAIISTAVVAALEEAQAAGRTERPLPEGHPSPLPWVPREVDLVVALPADAAEIFATLQDVLDTGERLAVEGELLIRPGLPEIIAVRDWVCEQIISQAAAIAASPWPGTDQERFERDVHERPVPTRPEWDSTVVENATTGVIAADDANRIIAISRSLAEELGWNAEDLVGRRVVTVVPPALREAHVAGFSRHLSTGEAHVLGVPVDLPVLRRDGTEVLCRFLVERVEAKLGRAVYLAWIDPLDAHGPAMTNPA